MGGLLLTIITPLIPLLFPLFMISCPYCRNPSFGLATKAKGITRVRAKGKPESKPRGSLGVKPRGSRESRQKEARESHHILPGVQESARECEKVLESVRE
jgi:hypothetical protein